MLAYFWRPESILANCPSGMSLHKWQTVQHIQEKTGYRYSEAIEVNHPEEAEQIAELILNLYNEDVKFHIDPLDLARYYLDHCLNAVKELSENNNVYVGKKAIEIDEIEAFLDHTPR